MARRGRKRKEGAREANGRLQRPPSKSLPPICFVYVIKVEGHDFIKVGKAFDISKRMSSFKSHMPFDFYLLDSACFFSEFEASLAEQGLLNELKAQKRFADIDPKHGEWFQADLMSAANLIQQTFPQIPWERCIRSRASEIIKKAG